MQIMFGLLLSVPLLAQTVTLENGGARLALEPATGSVAITDKATGLVWDLGAPHLVLTDKRTVSVRPVGGVQQTEDSLKYRIDTNNLEFKVKLLDRSEERRVGKECRS